MSKTETIPTEADVIATAAEELCGLLAPRSYELAASMTCEQSDAVAHLIDLTDPLPRFLQYEANDWRTFHLERPHAPGDRHYAEASARQAALLAG